MRDLLLILHIVGVAVWLGANVVQAISGPRAAASSREARAWWAGTQELMAKVLYNVAGILVLLTGVGLVLVSDDAYAFSDMFVSIGFLAVIVGAALGIVVFGPGTRKLLAAIESGDEAEEKALSARMSAFGVMDTLVVLLAIASMVMKWGV